MKRSAEHEAAILAAPDDLNERMVYGDWLQAEGDPCGEWIAMRARLEMAPADVATRRAALAVLAKRKKLLFGAGVAVISRAWIGWSGGFVDELRIQRSPATDMRETKLAALFAHPMVRFARHVAFGELHTSADMQVAIEALVAAKLPMLEVVIVGDQSDLGLRSTIDAIAELPIKRLGLGFVTLRAAMPQLHELTYLDQHIGEFRPSRWILDGKAPAVQKVTIVSGMQGGTTDGEIEQMRSHGIEVDVVRDPVIDNQYDKASSSPILARARMSGREAVRHMPQAGMVINNTVTHRLRKLAPPELFWLADIGATIPVGVKGFSFLNAAILRQKAGDHAEAELRAREALIWSPHEPNYHSMLIDALRRSGRLADAKRAIPRALKAIDDPTDDGHARGAQWALVDCMLALAQAADYSEALQLAGRYPKLLDGMHRAAMTIIYALMGDLRNAQTQFALAATKEPIVEHARAAIAVRTNRPLDAKQALAAAKRKLYGEMHWIAADPLLARL